MRTNWSTFRQWRHLCRRHRVNSQLHVGDGQTFPDGAVFLNGTEILAAGQNFDGNTVPPLLGTSNGLWDIRSFAIPAGILTLGSNNLTLTSPATQRLSHGGRHAS